MNKLTAIPGAIPAILITALLVLFAWIGERDRHYQEVENLQQIISLDLSECAPKMQLSQNNARVTM